MIAGRLAATKNATNLFCGLLVTSIFLGFGCGPMLFGESEPKLKVHQRKLAGASAFSKRAVVPVADVRIYRLDDNPKLPAGIVLDGKGYKLIRGFPNAQAPNLAVAEYSAKYEFEGHWSNRRMAPILDEGKRGKLIAEIKKRAGNAGLGVVLLKISPREVTGYGIHLSQAPLPTLNTPPIADLLQMEATRLEGKSYASKLTSLKRTMDNILPFSIEGEPGYCYWTTFALEPAARWSDKTTVQGVVFNVASKDKFLNASFSPTIDGTSKHNIKHMTRSGAHSIGCPTVPGPIQIDLVEQMDVIEKERQKLRKPANRTNRRTLGSGTLVFEVYTKKISAQKVAEIAATNRKLAIEAAREAKEDMERICRRCANKTSLCDDGDPEYCSPYTSCIESNFGSVSFCVGRR